MKRERESIGYKTRGSGERGREEKRERKRGRGKVKTEKLEKLIKKNSLCPSFSLNDKEEEHARAFSMLPLSQLPARAVFRKEGEQKL